VAAAYVSSLINVTKPGCMAGRRAARQ